MTSPIRRRLPNGWDDETVLCVVLAVLVVLLAVAI